MIAKTKAWIFGAIVLCAALLLYGFLGGLLPQLTSADSTYELAESTEAQNDIYRLQLQKLQEAAPNTESLNADIADLRVALPETAASEELLQQFHDMESSAEVRITHFSVDPPSSDEAPAPAPVEPTEPTEDTESTEETETEPTAQPEPATVSGVQQVIFRLEFSGPTREAVTEFLSDLQLGDRLITVEFSSLQLDETSTEMPWKGSAIGAYYVVADPTTP